MADVYGVNVGKQIYTYYMRILWPQLAKRISPTAKYPAPKVNEFVDPKRGTTLKTHIIWTNHQCSGEIREFSGGAQEKITVPSQDVFFGIYPLNKN